MPSTSEATLRGIAGECARRLAAIDWATTPLGPIAGWPASLVSIVATLLRSRQPMLLFWGPDLIQFYNDAFLPSLGADTHPHAMGQRATETWADAWPVVGAQIAAVMSRGEPAWFEDTLVPVIRQGRMADAFWTYSYSAACDDRGEVHGTLVIVTETTARVLAARRLNTLSQLSSLLGAASSPARVLQAMAAVAASAADDLAFFFTASGADELEHRVGIAAADARAVAAHVRAAADLAPVELATPVACARWPEPVRTVVTATCGAARLVLGLGPRLAFDDSYRSFVSQLLEHAASAERRIVHADASQSVERARDNLLMHAPVATALLTGPDHVFQLANPLYCKIVGRDPVGKAYLEAFPELRDTPLPGVLDGVYRTGVAFVASEQMTPLDRVGSGVIEDCYFNFTLEPLRELDGRIYGMMAVATDVTDQVRARHALERVDAERVRVLDSLQAAARAKDEFLAMLGHELRNPLAPIVTALELIKAKAHGIERECGVIDRQVHHVIRLVDDLLDVSRITRGLLALERAPVDLAGVVEQAVEANAELVAQRGHRVTVHAPRGIRVAGDEARLVQVVSNLITNAARYTREPGEIVVTLDRAGARAVLSVADTGIGIEPGLLPRIFDSFVQGARSAERAEGGLGLGLAIVRNLVAMHGGAASAHSPGVGLGSVFRIELPIDDSAAPDAGQEAGPAPRVASARRILVVDDNEDAAIMLTELVRMHGYADVRVAHHPADAIAIARDYRPDIAVLDLGLPDMDGYQLAAALREVCPDCRLLALTGFGQDKDRERSRAAGFAAHLVKPVGMSVLFEAFGAS